MKKILITLTFLLASLLLRGEEPIKMKIMSYNLRWGEIASMDSIGAYIRSEQPDLVAFQECDWDTRRPGNEHQHGVKFINVLANQSGMFGLYGKCIETWDGYYGIALLSKYPIIRSERVFLPADPGTEQRSILLADIELPNRSTVTFVCTHLEWTTSELRVKQVKFINRYLRKVKNPIILAGDFNAEPDSDEIKIMEKKWCDLTDSNKTFSTKEPKTKIDYIYARPKESVSLLSTKVAYEIKLSDHLPVISVIELD